jgi:hypothetical protein
MRYTVFSLDDRRYHYVEKIHKYLRPHGWADRRTEKVNGAHAPSLAKNIERYGYAINFPKAKVGHLGIWYTVLNSFELAPHVTFEDDAMLNPNFDLLWKMRFREMPEDTDYFSLFIPRDSDHLYTPDLSVSKHITRTYQRYGGVSMYYTQAGVEKIRALLERDGITDQYDNTLYKYAKAGELNGYCSKPEHADLVYITGLEDSIVQESKPYV